MEQEGSGSRSFESRGAEITMYVSEIKEVRVLGCCILACGEVKPKLIAEVF